VEGNSDPGRAESDTNSGVAVVSEDESSETPSDVAVVQTAHVPRTSPEATAETFLRKWETASKPILLRCDDKNEYVVKGRQAGRMLVNDHVVAKIGILLGAPVPLVTVIQVPSELISAEPEMSHMTPGLSHGSRFVPQCHDGGVQGSPENRDRFSRLAVLYGIVAASDQQFIYENQPPNLVHSVDHGHFFPAGPQWTAESLKSAPSAIPEPSIISACALTKEEVSAAAVALEQVTDEAIAQIVGTLPTEWGLSEEERLQLVEFLTRRREEMKTTCSLEEATG
jgi:hypothetical protein